MADDEEDTVPQATVDGACNLDQPRNVEWNNWDIEPSGTLLGTVFP